jgi:hypothetical protein
MRTLRQLAVFVFFTVFSGCIPDTGGIDPPGDELIFPVGLAMTHNSSFLLAVNSNFDLEYNSGTLVGMEINLLDQYMDLASLDPAMLAYDCSDTTVSEVSPDDNYCFVYMEHLIRETETVRVGAFASDLIITPSGDHVIIPVRGERAITLVDVDETGPDILSCSQGADLKCDNLHKVTKDNDLTLPIEPYKVSALEYIEENPDGAATRTTMGFATHLAGGEVSLFSISTAPFLEDGGVGKDSLTAELLGVIDGVVEGASGLAVNTEKKHIYVAGRHDPQPHVAVLQVITDSQNGTLTTNPWFNQTNSINLTDEMYGGTNARGIAVTSDGHRAFMVTRTPDAMVELDLDNYAMTDTVTVCKEPSVLELYEDDNGTTDTFDDKVYAFVLCFFTGQVYIIDTSVMLTEVRVTGAGPQAIAFDHKRKLAYIANFRESTVTVIQAVPPFQHLRDEMNRIVKFGKPHLPKGHD